MKIKIRPLLLDDLKHALNWSKDNFFCFANGWETNRSEEELLRWWHHCVNNVSEDFVRMGIEVNEKLVGYADLAVIRGNSAEIGIAVGDSILWGKGIGVNAARSIMEYASSKLGIKVFNAETHTTNFRASKLLENLGFEEISRNGCEPYLGTVNQLIQYRFICES